MFGAFLNLPVRKTAVLGVFLLLPASVPPVRLVAQESRDASAGNAVDHMRLLQSDSMRSRQPIYGHWGHRTDVFSNWTNHSNRLVPVYTFGIDLQSWRKRGSVYQDAQRLEALYGRVPDQTVNPTAAYFDQTNVYRLQKTAIESGKSNVILIVFDGMDWQTTRAASIYRTRKVTYQTGRGTGLAFQNNHGPVNDFGLICTSPRLSGCKTDVNSQTCADGDRPSSGGYNAKLGGQTPWEEQSASNYLIGLDRERPHSVTDSAAAATSMNSGIKTFNGAINVDVDGQQVVPIARWLQREKHKRIGVVTSVPISHATPAATYANNVSRKDYQDLSRDLLGLPSVSHRIDHLSGVDVLIGCGWGEDKKADLRQGDNFAVGNKYLHSDDLQRIDVDHGGQYVVAQRQAGKNGAESLMNAAQRAIAGEHRLLGFYGAKGGHLPFQTADGNYDPTDDVAGAETYTEADLTENPTLAEMTSAALQVLEKSPHGFWLMIEAGDVDWANHANNLDNSIGAVLSGDAAFEKVIEWIERHEAWESTAVILTADHGHFLVIDDAEKIAGQLSDKVSKQETESAPQ